MEFKKHNLKKSILSWREILLGLYGEPVEYDPKDIPEDYEDHDSLFPWGRFIDRVGEWFSCRNFMIGLDHVTTPVSMVILYKLQGRVYHQQIFSVGSNGRYGSGVDYRELRIFFRALKNRKELLLCINFVWAQELLKGAFKGTDNW